MGSENGNLPDLNQLPDAVVETGKRKISIVWLIPLVALVIGGWLALKTLSEKGPTITISFESAEGLEAGKTKIRYKEVEIGKVDQILLSSDFKRVEVRAQLSKQVESLLTQNTRFWIVRPRVAAGSVTGLGTLFSGAYIGMDPGPPGRSTNNFRGLEEPPIIVSGQPGRYFMLKAKRRGSIEVGSPVYFRQIRAGQVAAYHLVHDGSAVEFKIFINSPFHNFVYRNSRFWNASGIDVSLTAQGVDVNMESLSTLVLGGIAFDLPENVDTGSPAPDEWTFVLYENYEKSRKKEYKVKTRWLVHLDGSVRGLSPGAPVEFRGIPVGKVIDFSLVVDPSGRSARIPVIIEIEPERFGPDLPPPGSTAHRIAMDRFVASGLRAQLISGNLLTGQKLVSLDLFPEAPAATIDWSGEYPELPAVPPSIEDIGTKVGQIVDKINRVPIEEIGRDLRDTVRGAKRVVESPDVLRAIDNLNTTLEEVQQLVAGFRTDVAPEMTATLEQARTSLAAAESVLREDSALQYRLRTAMEELAGAGRALRILADYLEQHPESLIYGKGTQDEQ
jgi:paraquat-inducible protein B